MKLNDKNLKELESNILKLLNKEKDFLTKRTQSTRAIGDALESIIQDKLPSLLAGEIKDYFAEYQARAMEDLSFYDMQDNYFAVDVKTHNLERNFTMPNLTSIKRLSDFYESKNNYFMILMISYRENGSNVIVESVIFRPIENFSWSCLQVVNLGWGQLQIKDSNKVEIENINRIDWLLSLLDMIDNFYNKEIEKIKNVRISFFQKKREEYIKIYK